jgi:catalase
VPVRIIGSFVLDGLVDNFFAETEQVAFCTQNVVPGIGFSNDPLLQGRNFSYLDTQLKRLGRPNFTHIPINAPRCPVHNFQQDGHMAMRNPKGRANYEPNSWGGPRERPGRPATAFRRRGERPEGPAAAGELRRPLQPGAAVLHQPDAHRAEAHRRRAGVRAFQVRAGGHPPAHRLAPAQHRREAGHRWRPVWPSHPARPGRQGRSPTIVDLPPSDALSILKRGPAASMGRKLGILVTDGAPASSGQLALVAKAVKALPAVYEIITPKIGGATLDDGTLVEGKQKIDGGPSVLYDAVAILAVSAEGAALLSKDKPAKDFVSDAFGHAKFIGYTPEVAALFDKTGLTPDLDEACVALSTAKDAQPFLKACGALRFWAREPGVDLDAKS